MNESNILALHYAFAFDSYLQIFHWLMLLFLAIPLVKRELATKGPEIHFVHLIYTFDIKFCFNNIFNILFEHEKIFFNFQKISEFDLK
jgi:hypothetical protein